MPEQTEAKWYVVRTKPHQEAIAEASLLRGGIEAICPRIQERRMIKRRWQHVIGPLFPGYLFARSTLAGLRMITYARGVRHVVSFGAGPVVIGQDVMDEIFKRMEGGIVIPSRPSFARGDLVRVTEGPLQGLQAVFERELPGQQRALLLMRMLVGQVRVELDLCALVNA
ncbi:MAG: hypothetical protein NNA23_05735 [Nitrospira sp.]|nr:hypothetical protein [Nitrospira sp.]